MAETKEKIKEKENKKITKSTTSSEKKDVKKASKKSEPNTKPKTSGSKKSLSKIVDNSDTSGKTNPNMTTTTRTAKRTTTAKSSEKITATKNTSTRITTNRKSASATTEKNKSTRATTKNKSTTTTKNSGKRKISIKSDSTKVINNKEKHIQPTLYEYYDVPYRYNDTTVKILAQTPHALFVYWDISDNDRNNMIRKYGEGFFYDTKPILLVHNQTLNTSYEVEIDDFTNSWYLRTPTSNCVFTVELARRKININNPQINFENNSDILHIATSNTLESPNDHVLTNPSSMYTFKNIKTQETENRYIQNSFDNLYKIIPNMDNNGFKFDGNPSSDFKIS